MKKVIWAVTTVALATTLLSGLDIKAEAGDAFTKTMSKNRSSKNMEGANYVEIKNSDDLKKHGKGDLGVTVDGTKKRGTIYNYVEVKNAKEKENNFHQNRGSVNKYNSKNREHTGRNIGVKVKTGEGYSRGVKVKIHNNVKIKNSELD